MGRQVFGCDICQDVCPWNSPRRAPVSADPEMDARPELVNPALEALAAMDEKAFESAFNGSPVRRAGFTGLRRNIAIAMGNAVAGNREKGTGNGTDQPGATTENSQLQRCAPRLRQWAAEADEGLRAAAEWALARLGMSEDQRES